MAQPAMTTEAVNLIIHEPMKESEPKLTHISLTVDSNHKLFRFSMSWVERSRLLDNIFQ